MIKFANDSWKINGVTYRQDIYRITAVMKVGTDIIASITASPILYCFYLYLHNVFV